MNLVPERALWRGPGDGTLQQHVASFAPRESCIRLASTHRGLLRPLSTRPASTAAPSLGRQTLDIVKAVLRSRARLVGGGVLAAVGLYYVWSTESEAGVIAGMCGVFEAGGVARWDAGFFNDERATVERSSVEADLAAILRPTAVDKYAVIVGPSGTGKSTSVRKVVRALIVEGLSGASSANAGAREGAPTRAGSGVDGGARARADAGAGIVYFSARELLADFSQDLAKTVGYRTPIDFFYRIRRKITGETKEQATEPLQRYEPRATWSPMSRLLKEAAILYSARHGKALTLVLDAMDLVAKEDPKFFTQVQDFAKASADSGHLRVVFIFSDGDALPLLLSSSAASRCDKDQIYEVGDIDDATAAAFVVSRYKKDEQHAKELVETIIGGRFTLLQDYGKSVKPLDAIRELMDNKTSTELTVCGVSPSHSLFRAIAAAKSVKTANAVTLLEPSKIGELLRLNILAAHPNGTYTFNMHHVRAFVTKAIAAAQSAEAQARLAEEVAKVAPRWW